MRGTIVTATETSLVVQTAQGPVTVGLTEKTRIVGATPGAVADVVPGLYLGVGNIPGKVGNEAVEITIFDEKLRGNGEGFDGPWDGPVKREGSAMTNGTVTTPKPESMTNGTVQKLDGAAGKMITMVYKDGSKKITILPSTAIVHVAPGSPKLLVAKSSVYVSSLKADDGQLCAGFIVVGEKGTVVPL